MGGRERWEGRRGVSGLSLLDNTDIESLDKATKRVVRCWPQRCTCAVIASGAALKLMLALTLPHDRG